MKTINRILAAEQCNLNPKQVKICRDVIEAAQGILEAHLNGDDHETLIGKLEKALEAVGSDTTLSVLLDLGEV